jgi:hypothetical protein
MSENLKEYTTTGGRKIIIDISSEAIEKVREKYCDEKLNFGDCVYHSLYGEGNVVGVEEEVLWFVFTTDRERNQVSTFHSQIKAVKI